MLEFVRPTIRAMSGYTPGEQPRQGEVIKLNTNENPYPPSPRVVEAIRESLTGDRLRKYPDPVGTRFREVAGSVLDVDPDGIVIGNGSDDILTILTRAFVPEGGLMASPTPSYSLYSTLAELQGARLTRVGFNSDWTLPVPWPVPEAHLTLLANPNSPSGTYLNLDKVTQLVESVRGAVVVDEAYVDFADGNSLAQARTGKVIVSRTFSKSYALAGLRFGFAVTTPSMARELVKVKDSYNCDVLSLAAATAAMADQEYMRQCRSRILATRGRLEASLTRLGYQVTPSQANFVWARREGAKSVFEELKRRNILVRYMNYDGYGDGIRVSVGTDAEVDRVLDVMGQIG